jgi:2-haloacid dehalogenase
MPAKARRRILVFDVNETLLDITALEPLFARLFRDAGVLRQWFAELVLYSEALTLSGLYADYAEVGAAVLKMVAAIHAVALKPGDAAELVDNMRQLPPHADAVPALTMLSDAGFRMVTLTNSPLSGGRSPLDNAGLSAHFERQFSVDTSVKRFKPAPQTYAFVAQSLGVELGALRLVACHAWDALGAMAAGCASAMVTRAGNAPAPVGPQPDVVGPDLVAVARAIIEIDAAA